MRMTKQKSITDKPMASDCVDCNPKEINDYFDHLENALDGSIPAPFVINIDQSGFQEWGDKRNLIVVVPAEVTQMKSKFQLLGPQNARPYWPVLQLMDPPSRLLL